MATSAYQLAKIIKSLGELYNFDEQSALKMLGDKNMLPKKLIPKDSIADTVYASKQAKAFAENEGLTPTGATSGLGGKYTLQDLKKMLVKKVEKLIISPSALLYANVHKIDITSIEGTGKDGNILLADVKALVAIEPSTKKITTKKSVSDQDDNDGVNEKIDELKQELGGSSQDAEHSRKLIATTDIDSDSDDEKSDDEKSDNEKSDDEKSVIKPKGKWGD